MLFSRTALGLIFKFVMNFHCILFNPVIQFPIDSFEINYSYSLAPGTVLCWSLKFHIILIFNVISMACSPVSLEIWGSYSLEEFSRFVL